MLPEVMLIWFIAAKDIDYRSIIHDIRKSDAIHLLENSVFDDCGYIKLPDDITLKNVMILIVCVIKNGDKFSPRLFLEEALGCRNVGKSW